ncbi:PREDICTED: CXXC-type zinc finger protein 1 [Corvus brachyrhynchos]|uniref:CXXC-type zinc finger protein 1 n=1 Tax=Corvus brachyrhynchos TaxID=85066 RepID=UPI0008164955|nr:PREDICTED: CXXC-type zinc finger protein 1 [Corvus brachyrhynchos]
MGGSGGQGQCPGHSQGPEVPADEVCGCPLVRDVFELTGDFCRVPKRKCHRHYCWEKLRRAEVDLERVRVVGGTARGVPASPKCPQSVPKASPKCPRVPDGGTERIPQRCSRSSRSSRGVPVSPKGTKCPPGWP